MLILVRHGKSQWNLENRFTGWVDVDLCHEGVIEAKNAAQQIKELDQLSNKVHVFSSKLKRAYKTRDIILKNNPQLNIECNEESEALNERHYGSLQGMNKDEARRIYGEEQVHIWRRSYDTPPPNGESLSTTADRVLSYYHEDIEPLVTADKDVLIVAHGNSLRALIMHLKGMTPEEIMTYEIPTGIPIILNYRIN